MRETLAIFSNLEILIENHQEFISLQMFLQKISGSFVYLYEDLELNFNHLHLFLNVLRKFWTLVLVKF